ncbi:alanine racemase [bacterium]|nr:alanine racemase [bacterium]
MYASWVEVSRSAILNNLKEYQRVVGPEVQVMPILKSNAYGHGMVEVAKLVSSKVNIIGVVSLGEALELRARGVRKPIFVLSYAPSELLKKAVTQKIELPVYSLKFAQEISRLSKKSGRQVKVHLKIDTGTSRLGVLSKNALEFVRSVSNLPGLKIEGIWSHFAASEDNQNFTRRQILSFNNLLNQLDLSGTKIHFACSAAILTQPESRFSMVRLGIGLYGLWPSVQAKKISDKAGHKLRLKPALNWKTNIVQIKSLPAGTKVGYGSTYITKKKTVMAVLPVGYWEGYDRRLSNKSDVLVRGKRCSVLGRICMNLTMVDVSKVTGVKVKDEVVLLGKQAHGATRGEVSTEELADHIGTINYEVVTRINPLLPRVYVK